MAKKDWKEREYGYMFSDARGIKKKSWINKNNNNNTVSIFKEAHGGDYVVYVSDEHGTHYLGNKWITYPNYRKAEIEAKKYMNKSKVQKVI